MTRGDRLRMEIAALRATAKKRRANANRLVAAIDRLQRQIDAIFVDKPLLEDREHPVPGKGGDDDCLIAPPRASSVRGSAYGSPHSSIRPWRNRQASAFHSPTIAASLGLCPLLIIRRPPQFPAQKPSVSLRRQDPSGDLVRRHVDYAAEVGRHRQHPSASEAPGMAASRCPKVYRDYHRVRRNSTNPPSGLIRGRATSARTISDARATTRARSSATCLSSRPSVPCTGAGENQDALPAGRVVTSAKSRMVSSGPDSFWLDGIAIADFQHTGRDPRSACRGGRIGLQIHAGKDLE